MAPRPLVAAPEPVSVSTLGGLPAARPSHDLTALKPPALPSGSSASQAFRIQAGAYSDEENARRAASRLAAVGSATVEAFDRSGVTYYHVFVPGPADEAEAYAVRDKVAASGFADARVVQR
jgi:rare lipoprotein A